MGLRSAWIIALLAYMLPGGQRVAWCAPGETASRGSVLARAGLERPIAEAKDIALVGFNPNIGDNLIVLYSMIEPLHRINPGAVIHVISPTSRVLQESSWLKPVQLSTPAPESLRTVDEAKAGLGDLVARTKGLLAQYAERKPFYVFQESSTQNVTMGAPDHFLRQSPLFSAFGPEEKARFRDTVLSSYGEIASEMRRVATEASAGALFFNTQARFGADGRKGLAGQPMLWLGGMPPEAVRSRTNYEAMRAYNEQIFGLSGLRLTLPATAILGSGPSSRSSQDELEAFKKQVFAEPQRPYVVLNLNTKGARKRADSGPRYVPFVDAFLKHVRTGYGELNVLVAPVEPEFGPEVQGAVQALMDKGPGRVAFLPEGKLKLWDPLVSEAAAVVTQDSGFLHISNVLNKNVLSLGFSSAVDPRKWVLPRQSLVEFPAGEESAREGSPQMMRVYEWLSRQIPVAGAAASLRRCLVNEVEGVR